MAKKSLSHNWREILNWLEVKLKSKFILTQDKPNLALNNWAKGFNEQWAKKSEVQ